MRLLFEGDEQETLEAALSFLADFEPPRYSDGPALDQLALEPFAPSAQVAAAGVAAHPFMFGGPPSEEGGSPAVVSDARVMTTSKKPSQPRKKPPMRPKPGGFNPNRARDDRKKELVYLRNKVREMETQLEELKQMESNAPGSARGSSAMADNPTTTRVRISRSENRLAVSRSARVRRARPTKFVWEEIASRQYAERHKAELENIRLKMVLEGQIKVAKDLETLLTKRSNAQMMVQLYGDGTIQMSKNREHKTGEEEDAEIFDMLLADLDKSVHEVDSVFEANGLSKTEESFQDATVRNDDANRIQLEIFANKIMPFDIHATSDAVWKHLASLIERMPFRSYYERQPKKMETTQDTIVESFGVELHAKRTFAHFRVRQAMRRYTEENRVLIAWRQTLDPVEFSSQPTSGIRFFEKGYILIKRPTTRSPDFSLMQTSFIMTPQRFDKNLDHESKIGQLSDFFVDCIARNIYLSHQMIENFLVDESLKRER